jgi:hypothetical protein
MKTPTLIGTIIFMLSLLITALAAVQLSFFFPEITGQYFELFFIWILGIVGGIGLGYGNRESYGYDSGSNATIIGGIGLAGTMGLAFWMLVQGSPPIQAVIIAFVASILAIIGCYMIVVSTQETY